MADASGLIEYIAASPSPFHCARESAKRLSDAGYMSVDPGSEPSALQPGTGGYVLDSGSIIAWKTGSVSPAEAGFRILGAHTDSPNLRLKPNAEYSREGYIQWGVEVYGGVTLATWADRDLGLSGRVAVRSATGVDMRLICINRPIARIPNLAIHLNRKVNDDGLTLNKQSHLPPLVAVAPEIEGEELLGQLLAQELDVDAAEIVSWDLGLHDVHRPALGGLNNEFVFAPRLDNQGSCYPALEALLAMSSTPQSTAVIVLFDHEECGSGSERGAASAMLRHVLTRIVRDHADSAPGGIERAAANSWMCSADMAHGVHPNFADKHDGQHKPRMNSGPVIKTNVNMRYATNAETSARFKEACQDAGVPVQDFINRTDLACGTTIGPISASQLAISTVDVGNAMLSMHSIREQTGSHDVSYMAKAMHQFLLR